MLILIVSVVEKKVISWKDEVNFEVENILDHFEEVSHGSYCMYLKIWLNLSVR